VAIGGRDAEAAAEAAEQVLAAGGKPRGVVGVLEQVERAARAEAARKYDMSRRRSSTKLLETPRTPPASGRGAAGAGVDGVEAARLRDLRADFEATDKGRVGARVRPAALPRQGGPLRRRDGAVAAGDRQEGRAGKAGADGRRSTGGPKAGV
jgi:hypothetical protein